MIERVDKLLDDWRLDLLALTPEYKTIRDELFALRRRLESGEELKNGAVTRVEGAELHIQNIDPHTETIIVDGTEREVVFLTRWNKVQPPDDSLPG